MAITGTDPKQRFTTRVENYAKYRPGYPQAVLALLERKCGLRSESVIADIGSGTGILSELFLKNGNVVYGVEPNDAMRAAAERLLTGYSTFISRNASAEDTALPAQSVDFITAGQAFHWFEHDRARKEFFRILRPDGWVVLIWNESKQESEFSQRLEELIVRYGTDYASVKHAHANAEELAKFFQPSGYTCESLGNEQIFDFEGLRGRLLSSSYMPSEDDMAFQPMIRDLENLFRKYEVGGTIRFEYECKVFYGKLLERHEQT